MTATEDNECKSCGRDNGHVWFMQSEAQTTTRVCFLAVSAGDLKVAIVTKAPKKYSANKHLHSERNRTREHLGLLRRLSHDRTLQKYFERFFSVIADSCCSALTI